MLDVATISPDEQARLAAIRRAGILDTPSDGAFDRVAALAARIFDVPIATVTIVDEDRIWFKAAYGLDLEEITREPGLCASAILHEEPWIVEDASLDPRTLDNPLVRGELGLRFYAGAPIVTPDGYRLGTVNVIDRRPRTVDDADIRSLQDLAAIVSNELELRLVAREAVAWQAEKTHRAEHLAEVLQRNLLPPTLPQLPWLELAATYLPASDRLSVGGDFYDAFKTGRGTWALAVGDVCGKGAEAAATMGVVRHRLRALAERETRPSAVLADLNETLVGDGREDFCTVCLVYARRVRSGIRLVACCAGHPLPLIRRADGEVEPLGEPGMLLGTFADPPLTDRVAHLRTGDALVLYTDGLVELGHRPAAIGERALNAAIRSVSGDAGQILARIERAAVNGDVQGDDIAILVARALE